LRVAIIAPYYHLESRGNAVTVRRIERHLDAAGCSVRVFSLEEHSGEELARLIAGFAPDCIHSFHAVHGGIPARLISMELGIPYVVTLTGTDLYSSMAGEEGDMLAETLSAASALAVFHGEARERLLGNVAHHLPPIAVIPQGVEIPGAISTEPEGDFVFLLPAGIRPVKNVLFPIAPLARLHGDHPHLRLEFAGPLLDEPYGAEFMAAIASSPNSSWLGNVPFARMPALYSASHVVLNTSLSEGMASSLLEAMSYGRPVLAADIEGNRSLVRDGENGLLYREEDDFLDRARLLLCDAVLRKRLGEAGREFVVANCSPQEEAGRYLELYRIVGNI